MKTLLKLFKHKHKWKSQMSCSPFDGLYAEGWDYYYKCKCGAIKRKYIGKKEEIIELKEKGEEEKIIDMLNKMANGEKTPRYITYYNISKSEVETMLNCEENIIHKLEHDEIRLNSRIEPGDKSITTFNLISFNNDYPDATLLITMRGHITCSKNGVIYDSFDCRLRDVEDAWIVDFN